MPTSPNNKVSKPIQSKTAFVLKQHHRLAAKKVVERAKKAGLALDESYVYVIRSNARRKNRDRAKGKAPAAAMSKAGGTTSEREFRRLALELGIDKAAEVLSQTKKGIQNLIAGG